jgi:hypothetical protein
MKKISPLFIPLYNFECSENEIVFGKSISIKKCTKDEINKIKKIINDKTKFTHVIIDKTPTYFNIKTREFSIKHDPYFNEVLYSLKILKFGFLMVPYIILKNYKLMFHEMLPSSYFEYPYKLFKADIRELKTIYGFIKNELHMAKHPSFSSALWLFLFTSHEKVHQFRIINFFNCLEALFLKDGEIGELSYRLSLRAAYFLGKTKEERKKIFHLIKNGYNLRSKIIHGLRKKAEYKDFDFSIEIENCLRECLKKYLFIIKDFSSDEKIIEHINEIIL